MKCSNRRLIEDSKCISTIARKRKQYESNQTLSSGNFFDSCHLKAEPKLGSFQNVCRASITSSLNFLLLIINFLSNSLISFSAKTCQNFFKSFYFQAMIIISGIICASDCMYMPISKSAETIQDSVSSKDALHANLISKLVNSSSYLQTSDSSFSKLEPFENLGEFRDQSSSSRGLKTPKYLSSYLGKSDGMTNSSHSFQQIAEVILSNLTKKERVHQPDTYRPSTTKTDSLLTKYSNYLQPTQLPAYSYSLQNKSKTDQQSYPSGAYTGSQRAKLRKIGGPVFDQIRTTFDRQTLAAAENYQTETGINFEVNLVERPSNQKNTNAKSVLNLKHLRREENYLTVDQQLKRDRFRPGLILERSSDLAKNGFSNSIGDKLLESLAKKGANYTQQSSEGDNQGYQYLDNSFPSGIKVHDQKFRLRLRFAYLLLSLGEKCEHKAASNLGKERGDCTLESVDLHLLLLAHYFPIPLTTNANLFRHKSTLPILDTAFQKKDSDAVGKRASHMIEICSQLLHSRNYYNKQPSSSANLESAENFAPKSSGEYRNSEPSGPWKSDPSVQNIHWVKRVNTLKTSSQIIKEGLFLQSDEKVTGGGLRENVNLTPSQSDYNSLQRVESHPKVTPEEPEPNLAAVDKKLHKGMSN